MVNSLRPDEAYITVNWVNTGSDWSNGLSLVQCHTIIETNSDLMWSASLKRIRIQYFSLKKMHLKISSVKCLPMSPGPCMLTHWGLVTPMVGWVRFLRWLRTETQLHPCCKARWRFLLRIYWYLNFIYVVIYCVATFNFICSVMFSYILVQMWYFCFVDIDNFNFGLC